MVGVVGGLEAVVLGGGAGVLGAGADAEPVGFVAGGAVLPGAEPAEARLVLPGAPTVLLEPPPPG